MDGNVRKQQVFLGDLPSNFLVFDNNSFNEQQQQQQSSSWNQQPSQITDSLPYENEKQMDRDAQAARALHDQLNNNAAVVQAHYQPSAHHGIPVQHFQAASFIPPNTRGRLSICLAQARLTKNYGLVKMDPYCRVRVGNTVFETPTNPAGGKTPHWNRTVFCYLPNGIDSIYLEIFDERAFTTDERIAWNTIKIPQAVFNGDSIDDWYSLSGSQGEAKEGMINIIFTLYPITAPHVPYVPVNSQTVAARIDDSISTMHQNDVGVNNNNNNNNVQQQSLFTDKDVEELHEMFSNMDIEVIKSVMYEKAGNKDASINALLTIGNDCTIDGSSAESGTVVNAH